MNVKQNEADLHGIMLSLRAIRSVSEALTQVIAQLDDGAAGLPDTHPLWIAGRRARRRYDAALKELDEEMSLHSRDEQPMGGPAAYH